MESSEYGPRSGSHTIRRQDVPAWLADSEVKLITVHQTSAANARRIVEEGVRIEGKATAGRWGKGFYSSTRPLEEYGEAGVRVVTRLRHPLVV